ncbi:Shedu anti-phage system protein SduA domain-containing protein [Streptomyces sp. NPDC058653]|uniref:Shedu anti-phage system protein SduA domain-containing protein n=1 Tax=Streptomyces sp. NPDC058653 TaxID=3346576 RepID=UPI003652CD5C
MGYWLMTPVAKWVLYERAKKLKKWEPSPTGWTSSDIDAGDGVLLWRCGRGGGVVAVGKIVSVDGAARTAFDRLLLSTPLSAEVLRGADLGSVVEQAPAANGRGELTAINLTDGQWRELCQLADDAEPSNDWPAMWNIPPGSVVKRAEIHAVYGGNPRLAAGASGTTHNAFLFLEDSRPSEPTWSWDGSVLLAPGQNQQGGGVSMDHLAVLSHRHCGIPVRVFLERGEDCLYLGEFATDPDRPLERWALTGQRVHKLKDGGQYVNEVRTPVFRLHPLGGLTIPSDSEKAFQHGFRVRLKLQPVADQSAVAAIRGVLKVLEGEPALAALLGKLDDAQVLATLMQRARRQSDLAELRTAVEDPVTSEGDLQKLLQRMTWIFGGEFLPGTARRNLTLRDQLDLTLLRPDGSLHGVELKLANNRHLVTGQRNHLIVGSEVNKAVGQVMNYLRELDEKRAQILVDLGIDSRRSSMTVVIGHSRFVATDATQEEVAETIRTYNAHLNRVTITTYDQLIDNAQRTLDLTPTARKSADSDPWSG